MLNKTEKKLYCNPKMEMPSVEVLDAARNELPATNKKKLGPAKWTAIACSCLAVIAVIIVLPTLILGPANSSQPFHYIATDELSVSDIASVESYAAQNGLEISCFSGNLQGGKEYRKGDEIAFLTERLIVEGTDIEYAVLLDRSVNVLYQYFEEFENRLDIHEAKTVTLRDVSVRYATVDGSVYTSFEKDGYCYCVKLYGNADWQHILLLILD